ncbi:MAG: hypothetical protein OXN25_01210, partial [Candidatus Poribacteria bacterium]|nr:hypothetical protein [Candidatus Poribacteria bacterium]
MRIQGPQLVGIKCAVPNKFGHPEGLSIFRFAIFLTVMYNTCMPYYDEVFKHVTKGFPGSLAALALKTPEVEVGEPLNTEHITVRMHHSDMTFPVRLPDEEAILHIEAQTDDSTHQPMPLRMLAYSSVLSLEHKKNVYSTVLYFRPPAGRRDPGFYRYGNEQRGGGWFQYNVIRVYELAGEAFLDPEAVGLLPFTALMKHPADMTGCVNILSRYSCGLCVFPP